MIHLADLEKRYGRTTVLHDVDLDIAAGDAVALWGPNGAGKTTIIRCLLGFVGYSGVAEVLGLDARRHGKTVRRHLGYVPQELAFYDDLTVVETLRLSAGLRRLPEAATTDAIDRVELGEHASKRIRELSGGLKQRLGLAVALLADPPILLLDEPTSNLDARSRERTVRLLESLRGPDRVLVITSHHLEEVSMLVDRVVVLEEGRVRSECAPAELGSELGLRSWLHLILDEGVVPAAVETLQRAGFEARTNGRGVLVDVAAEGKARAITALDAKGFTIGDVEVWR